MCACLVPGVVEMLPKGTLHVFLSLTQFYQEELGQERLRIEQQMQV